MAFVTDLGAGKHPSPLGKKKKKKKIEKKIEKKLSSSLHSRKFLNYQKILFLSKVMVVVLPAPIYKVKYVRDHPGAGKHPSPLEKTKTNSPNHYLTVVFYRIKKYCSYQKLLRFKDCSTRTPVTSCQPPIDRYFGRVHIDRHIDRYRVYRDHVVCVEVFSHIFQDRQMIKPTYERQSFGMLHGPYKNFQR